MELDTVLLPDHYKTGEEADFLVHHFRSDRQQIRNNIILRQNMVCVLLNGRKHVLSSLAPIEIDNREMLLMSAGTSIMIHSAAAADEKLESLLIFFTDSFLRDLCLKHHVDLSGDGDQLHPVVRIIKDEFLLSFERSLNAVIDDDFTSLQRLKVEELLLYLALRNNSTAFRSFARNAMTNGHHNALREVVIANSNNGVTIEELAFLCNMSLSTFKRHFKTTFHCSPREYLTEKRMERARDLLRFGQRPSEIYAGLGYQRLSSFSTEFKKCNGLSPRQFQKTCSQDR
ncbi:MAG TPA: AraC family transcriptional regulator [Chryseosolibacter sp.]